MPWPISVWPVTSVTIFLMNAPTAVVAAAAGIALIVMMTGVRKAAAAPAMNWRRSMVSD